jgi:MFS family permease
MQLSEVTLKNHVLVQVQAFFGGAANGAYAIFAIPFLLRLDASITQISIYVALTSLGPLLIGPIAVMLLQNKRQERAWMLICGVLSRTFFFLPAAAMLFPQNKAEAAIIFFCLGAIPSIIFGALWAPIPGLVIDIDSQPKVINARITLIYIGVFVSNAIIGIGMWNLLFPYNYFVVFFMSGIAGYIEIVVISRIEVPQHEIEKFDFSEKSFKRKHLSKETLFFIFLIGNCLIVATSAVANTLQSVYFIKELNFSDRWMGSWAMALALGYVIGARIWRRVQRVIGGFRVFSYTAPLGALYFLFIVISPDQIWIIMAVLFAGIMGAGTDTGIWLGLYRLGSVENRSFLINIYIGLTLGIPFIAALFIPFLTDKFTLTEIFIGSFILRLLAGLYFRIPFVFKKIEISTSLN